LTVARNGVSFCFDYGVETCPVAAASSPNTRGRRVYYLATLLSPTRGHRHTASTPRQRCDLKPSFSHLDLRCVLRYSFSCFVTVAAHLFMHTLIEWSYRRHCRCRTNFCLLVKIQIIQMPVTYHCFVKRKASAYMQPSKKGSKRPGKRRRSPARSRSR